MKKTFVYFGLFVLVAYFSFVVGNFMAGLSNGEKPVPIEAQQQYRASEKSVSDYFNPFTAFSGYQEPAIIEVVNPNRNTQAPSESGSSLRAYIIDKEMSGESSNSRSSYTPIKRSNQNKGQVSNYSGNESNNYLSFLPANSHVDNIVSGTGSVANPTGNFGARVGGQDGTGVSTLGVPDPGLEPIPFDGAGIVFLVLSAIAVGFISLYKRESAFLNL